MIVPRLVPLALPLSDQVTLWGKLPVPETVAVNCCDAPGCTVGLAGVTDTAVTVGAEPEPPDPPDPLLHAVQSRSAVIARMLLEEIRS